MQARHRARQVPLGSPLSRLHVVCAVSPKKITASLCDEFCPSAPLRPFCVGVLAKKKSNLFKQVFHPACPCAHEVPSRCRADRITDRPAQLQAVGGDGQNLNASSTASCQCHGVAAAQQLLPWAGCSQHGSVVPPLGCVASPLVSGHEHSTGSDGGCRLGREVGIMVKRRWSV